MENIMKHLLVDNRKLDAPNWCAVERYKYIYSLAYMYWSMCQPLVITRLGAKRLRDISNF